MRNIASLTFLLALVACGSLKENAMSDAKLYEELFGPRCIALGYVQGTDAYADCKLKLLTTQR